jgi:hypothetical protein
MARTAGKLGMLAFVIAQLDDLLGMAGQAWAGNVPSHFDVQRRMGIEVAAVAGIQLVMRFPGVALTAERDDLSGCGRVSIMAILTANLGLVFGACRSDVVWSLAVTFDAVFI